MHSLQNKLRVVYVPFLLIAVGCVLGYSFMKWLLVIETEIIILNGDVANFWLPFALPWIPILVWLRPRFKALRFDTNKRNYGDLLYMAAAFAISVPTIVGQFYLQTACGKMTKLERISQIRLMGKTKYYSVRNLFPDKAGRSVETKVSYVGRNNESVNITVFVICPLSDSEVQTASTANLWLATIYDEQISSRLSDGELNARVHNFVESSLAKYRSADLNVFSYLERVGASEDRRGLEAAIKLNRRSQPNAENLILLPHKGNFDERNGDKLAWTFGSFAIGAVVWLLMLMGAKVDRTEMDRLAAGGRLNSDGLFPFYAFLLPTQRGHLVTPILIDLNALVFSGMVLAGLGVVSVSSSDLLAVGGNFGPAVQKGEYWRLISSMFIHGGVMHLFGNLSILVLVGLLLEPLLGPIQFAVCYFACGISGGIASLYWHKATVSVGASGAIFGLCGVLLGLSLMRNAKLPIPRNTIWMIILAIVGYNLVFGLIIRGIDNANHLGGLGCGIVLGLLGDLFPNLLEHVQSPTRRKKLPISSDT